MASGTLGNLAHSAFVPTRLADAERILIDDVGQIPLLYYSYHDIVSSKLHGFTDNVMDIHPSRFISKD